MSERGGRVRGKVEEEWEGRGSLQTRHLASLRGGL